MRRMAYLGAVALIIASTTAFAAAAPQDRSDHRNAAPRYHVVHGWPTLPVGEDLGAVAGLAADSHGEVFVFHRAGRLWPDSDVLDLKTISRPTIAIFDGRTGVLRREWGANMFAMPHGLSIDAHDNVWLTDVALQQVYEFSPNGQLLLTLGERGVAGNDAKHFNRPTAVAVAADGSFYVSDGYLNTRVMKFSAKGDFLFQWGTKGSGPGQFDLPHDVVLDTAGRVYVADRSNGRVQVFDATGHFLRQWKGLELGRPYAIALGGSGKIFLADGGDQPSVPPDRSALVVLRANGTPEGRIGRFGNYDGQFKMAHSIAVDHDGAVYVGDISGGRVQKFVPTR